MRPYGERCDNCDAPIHPDDIIYDVELNTVAGSRASTPGYCTPRCLEEAADALLDYHAN